ncbi:MAG: hypothetical protein ORN28_01555 [Rhodoferax sp.]|nr:hypothetical protein [Rhodoferax sp.]
MNNIFTNPSRKHIGKEDLAALSNAPGALAQAPDASRLHQQAWFIDPQAHLEIEI